MIPQQAHTHGGDRGWWWVQAEIWRERATRRAQAASVTSPEACAAACSLPFELPLCPLGGTEGPNFRIVGLGTDRRRIRRRTATIGVFGFATVQSVRNALADIERARLSDERLPVRTASCGSRRERFASQRVGEDVSSDVSLCTSHRSCLITSTVDPSKRYTRSYHLREHL